MVVEVNCKKPNQFTPLIHDIKGFTNYTMIFLLPILDLSDYMYWLDHYSFEIYANFTPILKKIKVLHRPNCYSWYVDSLCPFPITKFESFPTCPPYPKIYDLSLWASNFPYLFLFVRTTISICTIHDFWRFDIISSESTK